MNIEMIRAARDRLDGHARRTPLLTSPFLDEIAGRRVWVKPECLQHTGSFKFRGGWSAISAMSPETAQTRRHRLFERQPRAGRGVAAARHGAPAVIIMPSDAPKMKIDNTRALGADVVLYDSATENRDEIGSTALAASAG
jgi:threonine dehydratase